jgi:FkbM family methyltransferase
MRNHLKSALHKAGAFPIARAAYRRLNSGIRKNKAHEVAFYRQIVAPDSLCFDVGGNLGQKTEVLLECGARVVSVEPNPHCLSTLNYLFGSNRRVAIERAAMGRAEGTLTLHVHGSDSTASARPDWDRAVFGQNRKTSAVTVPVKTLDSLIEQHGVPDFVKVDVEGLEVDVLSGLSHPVPLVSFEFHASETSRAHDCLDILGSLGTVTMRAASMDCKWLMPTTDDIDQCIANISAPNAKGDLFVWIR